MESILLVVVVEVDETSVAVDLAVDVGVVAVVVVLEVVVAVVSVVAGGADEDPPTLS